MDTPPFYGIRLLVSQVQSHKKVLIHLQQYGRAGEYERKEYLYGKISLLRPVSVGR